MLMAKLLRSQKLFLKRLLTANLPEGLSAQRLMPAASRGRVLKFYLVISLLVLISGCYLQTSITELNPKSDSSSDYPIIKVDANLASEFVSGSDQYQTTLVNRYKILSSSGSFNRDLVNKTPNGYKVYSSVQGVLISKQEDGQ